MWKPWKTNKKNLLIHYVNIDDVVARNGNVEDHLALQAKRLVEIPNCYRYFIACRNEPSRVESIWLK